MFEYINNFLTAMLVKIDSFGKDEEGQTMVEYGLILALISIAAIAIMTTVGTNLTNTFQKVANKLG